LEMNPWRAQEIAVKKRAGTRYSKKLPQLLRSWRRPNKKLNRTILGEANNRGPHPSSLIRRPGSPPDVFVRWGGRVGYRATLDRLPQSSHKIVIASAAQSKDLHSPLLFVVLSAGNRRRQRLLPNTRERCTLLRRNRPSGPPRSQPYHPKRKERSCWNTFRDPR
jgi:hypothetical protein